MRVKITRAASVGVLLAAGLVIRFSSAHADVTNPKGISVSPAYQQVSIPKGDSSVAIKFIVTNHENKPQTINLSTRDFNTLSETGGLVFVGSNPTQLQKKYGLAKWISLPLKQLAIQPNQTRTIIASILNLPSLNPGGHYGALMLALSNGSRSSGSVSLHPIASSLLFVTKIGGDTHKMALAGVEAKHNLFSLPGSVALRFQNTGNSHVIPRGVVSLVDARGHVVSKGIINQNSDIVLPETYRKLNVPLQQNSHAYGIGKYKLVVDFRFSGFSQCRRYQTSFWFMPWYYFAVIIVLLVAVILAAVGYRNLRSWRQ